MKKTVIFTTISTLLLSFTACVKEVSIDTPEPIDRVSSGKGFSILIEDPHVQKTKALIMDDPSAEYYDRFENKVNTATLAAYNSSGEKVSDGYFVNDSNQTLLIDGMPLDDLLEGVYTVYALINMGDKRSSFPVSIGSSFESGFTYTITDYDALSTMGIPMAGKLVIDADDVNASTAIPVKRLMAKVSVEMTVNWPGRIKALRVGNMNKVLKPYYFDAATPTAGSAAGSASDLIAIQSATVDSSVEDYAEFTFFVPENRKGVIAGVTDSSDKSHDNAAVTMKDLATYIEVEVEGTHPSMDGKITYRSYLGSNSTSDFDVRRNCRYTWRIGYEKDGMYNDDWKHENDLNWSEYRFRINPDSRVYYYEHVALYSSGGLPVDLRIAKDQYTQDSGNLTLTAGPTTPTAYITAANYPEISTEWYTTDEDGNVSESVVKLMSTALSSARYNLVNSGTGLVKASIDDGWGGQEVSSTVTVLPYTKGVEAAASLTSDGAQKYSNLTAEVGQTVYFFYRTYTRQKNGTTTYGTWRQLKEKGSSPNTSPFLSYYGNNIQGVGASTGSTGYYNPAFAIKATAATTATANGQYYENEIGQYVYSNTVTVTFLESSHPSYIAFDNTATSFTVGETFTASLKLYSWSGSAYTATDISTNSSTSYSVAAKAGTESDPSKVSKGTGSNKNKFIGTASGAYTITATYSGKTTTIDVSWTNNPYYFRLIPATDMPNTGGSGTVNNHSVTALDCTSNPAARVVAQYSTDGSTWSTVNSGTVVWDFSANSDSSHITYTAQNKGGATVTNSSGHYNSATARATWTVNGDTYTATILVYWNELVIEGATSANVGDAVSLTAKLYRGSTSTYSVLTGSCTWTSSPSGLVSGGTVTSPLAQTVNVNATFTSAASYSYPASHSVVFSSNHIYGLVIEPATASAARGTSLQLRAYQTVDGEKGGEVTSSATWGITSGTNASVSPSGEVTISSTANGPIVVTATYSGKSATATIDVYDLVLGWQSSTAPSWVGQRGRLNASGAPAGTTYTFSVVGGNNEVDLHNEASSSGYVYVDTRKSGTATIRVSATKGGQPAGTKDIELTIAAPYLRLGSSTYYGNPDGGEIHTSSNGYSGSTPSAAYYTATYGGAPFSVQSTSSSTTLAVGTTLAADIYSEILEPVYSVQNSSPYACLGKVDGKVCVTSLTGYPSTAGSNENTGVLLGKLNADAKASTTGVSQVQADVYAVNPFASVSNEGAKDDLNDYSALNSLLTSSNTLISGTVTIGALPSVSVSSPSYRGFQVVASVSGTDVSGHFSFGTGSTAQTLYWNKSRVNSSSVHLGGTLSYRVTVINRHSSQTLYREYATGRMFVHGAFGPFLTQGHGDYDPVAGEYRQDYYIWASYAGNTEYNFGFNPDSKLSASNRYIRVTNPLSARTIIQNSNTYEVTDVDIDSGAITSLSETRLGTFWTDPSPGPAPSYVATRLHPTVSLREPTGLYSSTRYDNATSAQDPVFYLVGPSGETWTNNNLSGNEEKRQCGYYVMHLFGNINGRKDNSIWVGAD